MCTDTDSVVRGRGSAGVVAALSAALSPVPEVAI